MVAVLEGSLSNNDATKTSLKMCGCAVSNFIALMRSRSFRKMLADFSGPVVQPLDSALHQIKIYPMDNAIGGFPSTYPLDSDLSGG